MERVIVNEGTKVNMYQLFEDLQNYTQLGMMHSIGQLVDTYGVNMLMISGVVDPSDTSFKCSLYSNHEIAVQAGEGLTEALYYLPGTGATVEVGDLADGPHTLYAQHAYTYNTPVDIVSGFAYGLSGISQRNSRAHDAVAYVFDSPSISGIPIADFVLDSNFLTVVTDAREPLGINTSFIPGYHEQNTDTGTTASTFSVGGSLVELVPTPPKPPFNILISDVWASTTSSVRYKPFDAYLASEVRSGLITHEAAVSLKWGFNGMISRGSPATGQLNVVILEMWTGIVSFGQNDLIGYHFYAKNLGLDWTITANSAVGAGGVVLLTMTPYGHTTPMSSSLNFNTDDMIIHSNADRYEVVVTPVTESDTRVTSERYEEIVTQTGGAPIMQKTMDLFIGERVLVEVRAVKGSQHSAYASMQRGQYSKTSGFQTIQSYTVPYLVRLPSLDSTGASVKATASANGFTIKISPGVWDGLATDYELCWTTDPVANFSNKDHQKIVTSQTTYDVSTSDQRTYNVACRPLMAGQAVADPVFSSTQSGSGGVVAQDVTFTITKSIRTFSGAIDSYTAGTQSWSLTSLYSPAGQTTTKVSLKNFSVTDFTGSVLVVDNIAYTVSQVVYNSDTDHNELVIADLGTQAPITTGLAGKSFTVNTTLAGRKLYQSSTVNTNMLVTAVQVNQDSKFTTAVGSPVLRWYAFGDTRNADTITLNAPGQSAYPSQATNVYVPQGGFLVVDLWDETENDNTSGFKGTINITWKAYSGSNPNR
jgi:hypothetical protein